jgi:hypothetical protein
MFGSWSIPEGWNGIASEGQPSVRLLRVMDEADSATVDCQRLARPARERHLYVKFTEAGAALFA